MVAYSLMRTRLTIPEFYVNGSLTQGNLVGPGLWAEAPDIEFGKEK